MMVKFIQTGLFGDIEKEDRSAVDKSTCCDGPRFCIFDRPVRASRSNAHRCRLLSRTRRLLSERENVVANERQNYKEQRATQTSIPPRQAVHRSCGGSVFGNHVTQ